MNHWLRRVIALACIICLLPLTALAGYWSEDQTLRCEAGDTNCLILQMVMQGAFSRMDPDDFLSIRMLSAAFPRLSTLMEDDIAHFLTEFEEDQEAATRRLHIALGYCLWADILAQPQVEDAQAQSARRVMQLFLKRERTSAAREQRAVIRSQMTDDIIADIAHHAGVSAAFVEYVVYSDDWTQTE